MVISCSSYGCTNRRQKGSSIQFHRCVQNMINIFVADKQPYHEFNINTIQYKPYYYRFPLNRPDILNK